MNRNREKFDLEERTAVFGEKVVDLCKKVPKGTVTTPIIDQLMRAGTSPGSNYCEANGASSKRDFRNKILICKREAKETQYWLRLLARAAPAFREECRSLWQEAKELAMIFSKIAANTTSS